MTQECTTSPLPAIGTPLAVPVPAAAVAVGAARTFHRARRVVRRFRRAAVIVTCVTIASGATVAGVRYLPPLFGGYAAPPARVALVGGSAYSDYAAPNPSAMGPSYLPQVSGWAGGGDDQAVDFVPPASGAGRVTAITTPGPSPVPAPPALWLFIVGIFGLGWARCRRQPDSPEVTQARIELAAALADREEEAKVIGSSHVPHSTKAINERIAELRRIIDEPQKGRC